MIYFSFSNLPDLVENNLENTYNKLETGQKSLYESVYESTVLVLVAEGLESFSLKRVKIN